MFHFYDAFINIYNYLQQLCVVETTTVIDHTWTWSNVDKGKHISYDGIQVTHDGSRNRSLMRTDQCITKEMDNVYLEVTVINIRENGEITIGLSKRCPETRDDQMLGNFNGSLGYQSYRNVLKVDGKEVKQVEELVVGDTIGFGVHRMTVDGASFLRFYFTKNGEKIDASGYLEDIEYCPTIEMADGGGAVECNFGENAFKFNCQGMYILIFP